MASLMAKICVVNGWHSEFDIFEEHSIGKPLKNNFKFFDSMTVDVIPTDLRSAAHIMKNRIVQQMELTMNKDQSGLRDGGSDRRRHDRARWWFHRMRQVLVSSPGPMTPVARPEQTYFPLRQM